LLSSFLDQVILPTSARIKLSVSGKASVEYSAAMPLPSVDGPAHKLVRMREFLPALRNKDVDTGTTTSV